MFNKKILQEVKKNLNNAKKVSKPRDIIDDINGQWTNPGKNTRVRSKRITMKGVEKPVLAVSNIGQKQMMEPEGEYYFPGADYVDEYPQMKKGGLPKAQKGIATFKDSLDLYKNSLIQQDFYNKMQPFYNPVITSAWNDPYEKVKLAEAATLLYKHGNKGNQDKWTAKDKSNFETTKKIIKANKDPNVAYITDMITGNLDPNAPALRYDARIKPQGKRGYKPWEHKFTVTDTKINDKSFNTRKSGEPWIGNYDGTSENGTKEDWIKWGKKNGFSEKDITSFLYKRKKANAAYYLKGQATEIPYYDPLAIKPGKLLTDDEVKKRVKKYGTDGIPKDKLEKLGLKDSQPPKKDTSKVVKSPCSDPITTVINNVPEKAPFGKKLVGTDSETLPVTGKKCEYVKTINPIYEDIIVEPIELGRFPVKVDNGALPPLQVHDYSLPDSIEAPQYTLDPYTADRLSLDVKLPQNKIAALFDRGVIDSKGHIALGKRDKTRLIPRIVQKVTGYDPAYFEGYEDEEGNFVPGELDYGNATGSQMEFRGAASLRDLMNQQKYQKEYEEYEKNLDAWLEKYEQSKRKQEQGQSFKKGGTKKYSKSLLAKNRLFVKNKLFKKKNYKNKIYDPSAMYFQDGGTLPKAQFGTPEEFYKYWFENRVMPTSEGQKLLEKIRPEALERASQSVPYIYSEKLNPDEAGYYDPETQQIILNKDLPEAQIEATKLHEFGHHVQGDKFYDVLGKPHQYLVEQNIVEPKEIKTGNPEWDKNLKENYDDVTPHEEIWTRAMKLRYDAGFKPDQVITVKNVEDFFKRKKEAGEALDPDIEDLRGVTKGTQGIVNLLNDMVSVPSNREDLTMAQFGGPKGQCPLGFVWNGIECIPNPFETRPSQRAAVYMDKDGTYKMDPVYQQYSQQKFDVAESNKKAQEFNKLYAQSKNYKRLLKKQGYTPEEINDRINSVMNINDFRYIDQGQSWVGADENTGKEFISYNVTDPGDWPGFDQIAAHEWGHVGVDSGANPLKEKEREEFINRINKEQAGVTGNPDDLAHDMDAQENRADLVQLKQQLQESGIFDSTKRKRFTKKDLNKYKEAMKSSERNWDNMWNRMFRLYDDDSIIYFMNNVAKNNSNEDVQVAKYGVELDLTEDEIKKYVDGGYVVEDISVPSLTRMQFAGEVPDSTYTPIDPNFLAENPDIYSQIVNKPEVTTERQGSDIGKLRAEYREKNPLDIFLDEKKRQYLKKNKGLNKAAGVTMDNFPEDVLQNFMNEYDYKTNTYAVNKLGKKEGWNPKRRGEWVDELTPGERDAVAESKYGSKLQPSYWSRSLAGVQELGNTLLPGQPFQYNIPGLTKKEQKEMRDSKLSALETLAPIDIPGAAITNLVKNTGLSTGSDYKELPGVLSGEKMSNVSDMEAMALNPLTYAGLEAIPELGVNLVRGIGKGVTMAPETISNLAKFIKTEGAPKLKQYFDRPPGPLMIGLGSGSKFTRSVPNPDYFLDVMKLNKYSPTQKKYFESLIQTVKNQGNKASELQFEELQRIKTGDYNYGKRGIPYEALTVQKETPAFRSEIDWRDWVKYKEDFDNNPNVIQELNDIEKANKEAGTWMKNADGTPFQGTPEQFVVQQSTNWKNAFPEYYGETLTTRSNNQFDTFDESKFGATDEGWYGKGIYAYPTQEAKQKGLGTIYGSNEYDLYVNSANKGFVDEPLEGAAEMYQKNTDQLFNDLKAYNEDYIKKYGSNELTERLVKESYDDLLQKIKAAEENDINQYTTLTVPSSANETVIPFSNRVKSAKGNILFDMTNPNMYKAMLPYIIPAGLGVGAASQMQGQESNEGYKQGGIVSNLTKKEIDKLIKQGYIIEEID